MSSTHGTSSNYGTMRDGVRDTVKDVKDAVARESSKAVSEAGSNIQADLDSLRNEIRRLADQITDIVTAKGSAAGPVRCRISKAWSQMRRPKGRTPSMRPARLAAPWWMPSTNP
jgi:hypothetical protein